MGQNSPKMPKNGQKPRFLGFFGGFLRLSGLKFSNREDSLRSMQNDIGYFIKSRGVSKPKIIQKSDIFSKNVKKSQKNRHF